MWLGRMLQAVAGRACGDSTFRRESAPVKPSYRVGGLSAPCLQDDSEIQGRTVMSETLHLEGDLYIETFTNNVSNRVIGPVDVNSLEVKPDSEKISIPSKRKHKLGQARESYFVPKPATVNIKTSEIPPVLLAAAFMGLESPINQGAGTLTEVPVTLLAHPKWVSLGKTNLSATGLVVKKATSWCSVPTLRSTMPWGCWATKAGRWQMVGP